VRIHIFKDNVFVSERKKAQTCINYIDTPYKSL